MFISGSLITPRGSLWGFLTREITPKILRTPLTTPELLRHWVDGLVPLRKNFRHTAVHFQVACPANNEHLNPPRRCRAPVGRTMYKARARQPLRDFAREHFLCAKPAPAIASSHDRARAPFLRRTSWQTLRRPKAHARATCWDCRDRHTARTRWMYAVLPGTGRPAATSFKSRERNLRRNQDQYFSTGFKSGLLGGTRHRLTDARSCAAALFAKKDSLAQNEHEEKGNSKTRRTKGKIMQQIKKRSRRREAG